MSGGPPDPHALLGVAPGASQAELRLAYRLRVRDVHPDVRPDDPEASRRFRELRAAYELLSSAQTPSPGPASARRPSEANAARFARVLEERRASARLGRPPSGQKGDQGELEVPFAASILGGDHRLLVRFRHDPIPRSLLIALPPGLWSEERLKIEGKVVHVRVQPDPHLVRVGDDVELDVPLSISEAALGTELLVPTVRGMATLRVPPGTAAGRALALPGLGVPPLGVQRCVLGLTLPDPSRAEVRDCLLRLAALEPAPVRPWDES